MTENDRTLIARARELDYTDWYLAMDMEERADTEEARRVLHSIGVRLYHTEEAAVGNI